MKLKILPNETDIQKGIIDYLTIKGYFVLRMRNQPLFSPKTNSFWKSPHNIPGLADLLVVKLGKAIFLEVKRPGQKPRPDQLDFGRSVLKAGGDYFIIHSIEEVQALGL